MIDNAVSHVNIKRVYYLSFDIETRKLLILSIDQKKSFAI